MGKFKRKNNGAKPKRAKPGQPSKYNPDLHPRLAYELGKEFGCRLQDLSVHMGVPYGTLCEWWKDHEEFSNAIKAGRDIYDTEKVEAALLKRALGYDYTEVKTEEVTVRTRRQDGTLADVPALKTIKHTKQVLPNITAAFFWLVNRSAGRWQHIQNVKVDVEGNINSNSRVHVMDWSKIGAMMGLEKLESLRNLFQQLPEGTAIPIDTTDSGTNAGGKQPG